MSNSKRIVMGFASLSMVAGLGYVMQNVLADEAAPNIMAEAPEKFSEQPLVLNNIALTAAPIETSVLSEPATGNLPVMVREPGILAAAPVPDGLGQPDGGCDVSFAATPVTGAMVELSFSAPCMVEQRVTFHHTGMMFTYLTDAEGAIDVTVPALASFAVFIADAGPEDGAVAHTQVLEIQNYERAVAQWRGDLGVQLHALEFGATYGEAGHVWVGQDDQRGEGQVIRLGDDTLPEAYLAEVYTLPKTSEQTGQIALSVEAEVTPSNCGKDVLAETLQISPDGGLVVQELTLSMPGCDAQGDFLLLKNLLQNLTIAAK